jgi:hypothetical protein
MCGNKKKRSLRFFFLKRGRGSMNVGFMVTYIVHIIGRYRPSGKRESAPFLKIVSPPPKKIIVN